MNVLHVFRKASKSSESANCVEVAACGCAVLVRDSKNPDRILRLTAQVWSAFLADIRIGLLDL